MVSEQFLSQLLPQIRTKRQRTTTDLKSRGYIL